MSATPNTAPRFMELYGVALLDAGFDVVPIQPGLKHPGIAGWVSQNFAPAIRAGDHDGCGIGVRTANTPAIDVDALDAELANGMRELLNKRLKGVIAIRTGLPPKFAIVCRTSRPFKKVTSQCWRRPDAPPDKSSTSRLEILGEGQQIVAYHIHPTTGLPYEWQGASLFELRVEELPEIDIAAAQSIAKEFDQLAESMGFVVCNSDGTLVGALPGAPPGSTKPAGKINGAKRPASLLGPMPAGEVERLWPVLVDIDASDYDDWVAVGQILHGRCWKGGFELWDRWSQLSGKYPGVDELRAKWATFDINGARGLGSLFHLAAKARAAREGSPPSGASARPAATGEGGDPVGWVGEFVLSDAEIDELKSPEWIVRDIVISGHLLIVVAEPNGGKTTVFAHLAGEMVQAGFRVFYVNADIAGSDAACFIETAREGGWAAMLPDMRPGLSMQSVVDRLTTMNDSGGDLSGIVFVFDTFKKMTDVIAKRQVRDLLKLLRSLTAKGMTVILLGHTNKYRDADGKPVFEGTGDVRADADELIYLIPQKHADGSMTVSTAPDKVRGDFKPITFNISRHREVTRAAEYIDTATARANDDQYRVDMPDIRVILDAIDAGLRKQTEILEHCKQHRVSKRTALRVFEAYAEGTRKQWIAQRGFERNTIRYFPLGTAF
jgi:hypothetical protein